jgi:menaquinone-specific isochorismate synthase
MTLSVRTPMRLRAHTIALDDPGDLLDHLGADGFAFLDGDTGFVTAGRVLEVPAEEAVDVLRAIDTDDPARVRAVGALPFTGGGRLVVPARIVARDTDGRAWQTEIEGAYVPTPLRVTDHAVTRYEVATLVQRPQWEWMVRRALDLIDTGTLSKVVLSRVVEVRADRDFDARGIASTLRAEQPGCTVYVDRDFVGASPELLVRRVGRDVLSRPLAGTGARATELLASDKDGWEHRIVIDAMTSAFSSVADDVCVDGPRALELVDVTHLATTISARLRDESTSAADLALRLHPTPAVGGAPTTEALHAIAELEAHGRGRYAGPCGWVDATGDGDFVLALRGAQLTGKTARLHSGAGIVAGSIAESEWAETQAKLAPMLHALIRP